MKLLFNFSVEILLEKRYPTLRGFGLKSRFLIKGRISGLIKTPAFSFALLFFQQNLFYRKDKDTENHLR